MSIAPWQNNGSKTFFTRTNNISECVALPRKMKKKKNYIVLGEGDLIEWSRCEWSGEVNKTRD